LIFGVLKASYEIFTLNNDFAHWAIVLIATREPHFSCSRMERYVFAFSRGMDADGDGH
jgi:hypothetical protein